MRQKEPHSVPSRWARTDGPDYIRRAADSNSRLSQGRVYRVLQSALDSSCVLRCRIDDDHGERMWAVVKDNGKFWVPMTAEEATEYAFKETGFFARFADKGKNDHTLDALSYGWLSTAAAFSQHRLSLGLGPQQTETRNEEKPMRKVTIENKVFINGRELKGWSTSQIVELITEEQQLLSQLEATELDSAGINALKQRHRENIAQLDEALTLVLATENDSSKD